MTRTRDQTNSNCINGSFPLSGATEKKNWNNTGLVETIPNLTLISSSDLAH